MLDRIEAGRTGPAIGQLNTFINQVSGLIDSGLIPAEEGAFLIAVATQVLDWLAAS